MRLLHYLIVALKRFTGAPGAFGDWKAHLLLLWMEGSVAISLVFVLFEDQIGVLNRFALAVAVILPLLVANEYLLARTSPAAKHSRAFSRLPRGQKRALYVCAGLLIFIALSSPLVVRTFMTGKPWWK